MLGMRPKFSKKVAIRIPQCRDIIEQRIKPNIGDEILIKRQCNTPPETGFRTRNAQITQRFSQKCQNLVFVVFRTNKIGVIFDVLNQPVLIIAHLEKIVRLFDGLRLGIMIRAFAVYKLSVGIESLAPETVLPFVFTEIDLPLVVNFLKHLFDDRNVIFFSGSNKVTVSDVELRPEVFELSTDAVDIGARA